MLLRKIDEAPHQPPLDMRWLAALCYVLLTRALTDDVIAFKGRSLDLNNTPAEPRLVAPTAIGLPSIFDTDGCSTAPVQFPPYSFTVATLVATSVPSPPPPPPPPPPPSPPPPPPPSTTQIHLTLDPARKGQPVNPLLAACHLDEGYVHASRSLDSNMIYGSAFDRESVWNTFGTARGNVDQDVLYAGYTTYSLSAARATPEPAPRAASASASAAGISNRGMGNEGLFVRGSSTVYEGWVLARADTTAAVSLTASFRKWVDSEGTVAADPRVAAAAHLELPGNAANRSDAGEWTNLSFTLVLPGDGLGCTGIEPGSVNGVDCGTAWPNPAHVCIVCGGEFFLGVEAAAGSATAAIHIAYVFVQPGPAQRFGGLSVKREGVENLVSMGITGMRVGGTYAQGIYWKDWRGPVGIQIRKPSFPPPPRTCSRGTLVRCFARPLPFYLLNREAKRGNPLDLSVRSPAAQAFR